MLRAKYQGDWPYKYVGEAENAAVDAFLAEVVSAIMAYVAKVATERGVVAQPE